MTDGRTAPLKVVCVDDEVNVLRLLQTAAGREPDFEIVAVTNDPRVVLDLITRHRPDVLILDDPHALPSAAQRTSSREGPAHSAGVVRVARALIPKATVAVFSGGEIPGGPANDLGDVWVQKPHLDALWPAIREARSSA
jgi:DNA-binding NarL/FixJ family response regulator